jgi:DNA-binding PadR family transcriptional regulator
MYEKRDGPELETDSRHGRHGGRHHRLKRFFEHGDLRLVALQLVAEKPRHGYEIIKAIEEKSGGLYTPSAGAVYPTLTLLHELGHIAVMEGDDGRKLHSITKEGKAALLANRKTIDAIFARIALAGATEGLHPEVELARRRIKSALRLCLSRGALTPAQVKAIVATLNEAASAIETI